MIIAKQVIKNNQILSVGMESFYWKNSRKTNESAVSPLSDMANVSYKGRINRINIVQVLLLLSMPKKFKEVLRTRLSGNKITWIETCLDQKNAKWKTTSNQGTLACYEDLPIITHFKILCNLFLCDQNTPFPPNQSLQESTPPFLK